jgi:hypothetical protein
MAYQSGTLNVISDFNSVLDTFLLANGWTKTNNSAVVANVIVGGSSTSGSSGMTTTNSFINIPTGALITGGSIGSARVVLKQKTTATALSYVTDITVAGQTATLTFSWATYTKGTKNFNFNYCNYINTGTGPFNYPMLFMDMYHAASGNGSTSSTSVPCVQFTSLSSFPLTYQLFYNTSPEVISIVFLYGNTVKHMHFGDIVKVHSSAYVGGEFFTASSQNINTNPQTLGYISESTLALQGGNLFCTPSGTPNLGSGLIHAEIDGSIYSMGNSANNLASVGLSSPCCSSIFRGLNQWNSQATLITPELVFQALSGFKMPLGYLEHIRFVRIDNYNNGDIITLGTDQWKVFSVETKNAATRNGNNSPAAQSGTIGFACRYTP